MISIIFRLLSVLSIGKKIMDGVKDFVSTFKGGVPFSDKELALAYVFQFIGKWYKWGGDDPKGFDCSGLALEYLKALGLVDRKADMTAESIFLKFQKEGKEVKEPDRGCLVFWKNTDGKIIHVEIMLNKNLSLGASGGGSKTLSEEDAIRDNAFIKVRKVSSREGISGYIDPFKN